MVWICDSCGQGNLDSFFECIQCNTRKEKVEKEKMNCWAFHKCPLQNREDCIVFQEKNDKLCYQYKKISRRCIGHENKKCEECEWYKYLLQK